MHDGSLHSFTVSSHDIGGCCFIALTTNSAHGPVYIINKTTELTTLCAGVNTELSELFD